MTWKRIWYVAVPGAAVPAVARSRWKGWLWELLYRDIDHKMGKTYIFGWWRDGEPSSFYPRYPTHPKVGAYWRERKRHDGNAGSTSA